MKKEYDFSKAKKAEKVVHRPKVMVSLRLDPHLVSLIRDEADRLGMPYQTLISSLVHRYVTGELIDKKEAKKVAG